MARNFGDIPVNDAIQNNDVNDSCTIPTGTGFHHVTAGVEDAAAKLVENADVAAAAGIVESKLALNFATHAATNDPSVGEKAALAGTSGAPGGANKYVTNGDSRNSDARTPTAHEASHRLGGSDALSVLTLSGFTGETANFLRADGTFAAPGGGSGIAWRLACRWHDARTFANIGTSFVNVYNVGLNGQRQFIDFTGFTQFRMIVHWNNIGGSIQNVRAIDDADTNNVLSDLGDGGTAGEKELNSGWVNLPAWASGEKFLRLQAKAATAGDDPVFRGCSIFLK